MSAQRPLTPEREEGWEPVQQATAGPWGAAERSGSPHGSAAGAWRSLGAPRETWAIAHLAGWVAGGASGRG